MAVHDINIPENNQQNLITVSHQVLNKVSSSCTKKFDENFMEWLSIKPTAASKNCRQYSINYC